MVGYRSWGKQQQGRWYYSRPYQNWTTLELFLVDMEIVYRLGWVSWVSHYCVSESMPRMGDVMIILEATWHVRSGNHVLMPSSIYIILPSAIICYVITVLLLPSPDKRASRQRRPIMTNQCFWQFTSIHCIHLYTSSYRFFEIIPRDPWPTPAQVYYAKKYSENLFHEPTGPLE